MAEVTLDDVWRLFKETDQRFKEIAESFKATDKRSTETEEKLARYIEEGERLQAQAEAARVAAERRWEAADRRWEESRRELAAAMADLSRKMGQFSNRLGEFAEDMVVPTVGRLFQERGLPVHQVMRRVQASFDGHATDFDILVVNANHVMAIEVKSRVSVQDVDEHLDRLANFKRYLPRYADCRVMGVVAGLCFEDGVDRYAYRQGLYVLGQSGETVVILNDDKFRPRVW